MIILRRIPLLVVLLVAALCPVWAQIEATPPAKPTPVGRPVPQIPQSKAVPPTRITLEQAGSRTGRDRAPAYEGKDVVVTGQVSTRPIWVSDSYYVAIQDDAHFGLLLRP